MSEFNFSSSVFGMHCANCVVSLEKAISQVSGVQKVSVNLHAKKVVVSGSFSTASVKQVILDKGYSFEPPKEDKAKELWIVWFLAILVFFVKDQAGVFVLLVCALAGDLAKKLTHEGLLSLRKKDYKMETLIFIGVWGAALHHIVSLLYGNHGMGKEGVILLAIYLTGQHLESRLKDKADIAIKDLLNLLPDEVVLIKNGKNIKTKLKDVKIGDSILVLPGQSIPLDGIVTEGESEINESLITGESEPVLKVVDDGVIGGTLNISGRILIKVNASGNEGYLSKLVEMVENASAANIPVQGLVDRIVAIFVPIVLWAAGLAGVFWLTIPERMIKINQFLISKLAIDMEPLSWFMVVLAVLVVSCPCPLGIATPLALFIGAGRGAKIGLIIRDGKGLEDLKSCKVLILDKTGTLTTGNPTVQAIFPSEGFTEEDVLQHAASAEEGSEHPIAKAILKNSKSRKIKWKKLENYKYQFGSGVEGLDENGNKVMAGSIAWALSETINVPNEVSSDSTIVAVSVGGKPIGLIALNDEIRNNAFQTIRKIEKMKIKIIIASGDREESVKAVADKLSIKKYFYAQKPEDKLALVGKYQKENNHVVFAGDGVNDAPALAAATVGIAMGDGSDLAKQNGELVLPKGNLLNIYKAIVLSQKTFSIVGQNLFWAAIYNVVAIPLAFFGVLHPIVAQSAMVISDLIVILNSLRLQKIKI